MYPDAGHGFLFMTALPTGRRAGHRRSSRRSALFGLPSAEEKRSHKDNVKTQGPLCERQWKKRSRKDAGTAKATGKREDKTSCQILSVLSFLVPFVFLVSLWLFKPIGETICAMMIVQQAVEWGAARGPAVGLPYARRMSPTTILSFSRWSTRSTLILSTRRKWPGAVVVELTSPVALVSCLDDSRR